MGAGMAVMSAPPTADLYGTYTLWWTAAFGGLCLGGFALCVRHVIRHGARNLHHGAHLVIGSAAMVLMTLAMPGATSEPVLAWVGSSGHGHGAVREMAGMGAHGGSPAVAVSDSGTVWRAIFWVLAAYFLVSVALAVRARMPAGTGDSPLTAASVGTARHRRAPRGVAVLAAPNVRLAGHAGMGGSMASMLLLMTGWPRVRQHTQVHRRWRTVRTPPPSVLRQ
jgi:hypothetical protein